MLQRGVAQGLERLLWEQDVGGSIPLTPIFYLIKRSELIGTWLASQAPLC